MKHIWLVFLTWSWLNVCVIGSTALLSCVIISGLLSVGLLGVLNFLGVSDE